jgi:rhodanese-related sulfurtransferase
MSVAGVVARVVVSFRSVLLAFGLTLQPCALLGAQEHEQVPEKLSGVTLVSASDARALLGKASFIDTRILHDYLAGHLPGALPIPYKEISARSPKFNPAEDAVAEFLERLGKFVPDKAAVLVFYCNGPSCWKSYKASKVALNAGYSNVHWLHEGLAGWQSQAFELVQE